MRLVRSFFAALCLVAGVVVGALNRSPVAVDFGAFELHSTVGVALIVSLLIGVLAGGASVAFGTMRDAPRDTTEGHDASRSEV